MADVTLGFPRTWVEFVDPEHSTQRYRCDLTWLTSAYRCIFGTGCPGIVTASPSSGCCALGAHFSGDEDLARVAPYVAQLTPEWWQGHPGREVVDADWTERDSDDELKTRVVLAEGESACVLHNRPGFAGGTGCALHLMALETGAALTEAKPDVCWQLPLHRTYRTVTGPDEVQVTEISIGEYGRASWGPGGHDLDWYCTSNPEAHVSPEPVYLTHRDELVALMSPAAYDELARHCDAFLAGPSRATSGHPASR